MMQQTCNDDITTTLSGSIRVSNGLDAFADPDVLAAIGGSPYADDLAAANLRPADVLTFTFTADLPGDPVVDPNSSAATTAAPATVDGTAPEVDDDVHVWTVPLDGTSADLATTSVLAQGGGGIWGTVATVALVALIAWVLFAIGFILMVAKARRDRARRRIAR